MASLKLPILRIGTILIVARLALVTTLMTTRLLAWIYPKEITGTTSTQ